MGSNSFIALPSIDSGAQGGQPQVDLFSEVPSTGLSGELTILCSGGFIGEISVQGSTDGQQWSVLTQFDAGLSADGERGTIAFSPHYVVDSIVRYLRAFVHGRVTERTTLSVAGEANCDCPTGSSEGIVQVDSIESVGVTLLDFDASALDDGDLVYVGNVVFPGQHSILDYVRVRIGANLTPAEGEVWDSNVTFVDGDPVQFERLHTPAHEYFERSVWFITNNAVLGTAIIDNDGDTSDRPVSMREANRRRAADSQGIGTVITIVFPEDMGFAARSELHPCMLSNWQQTDGNAGVVLIGQPTIDFSVVIETFIPANSGENLNGGYIVIGTGLGTNSAIGKQLRVNAGDDMDVLHAGVVEILGPDSVRCTQPRTASASNYNSGSPSPFLEGSTIEVLTNRTLPIWPFIPEQLLFPAAQYLDFVNFDSQFNEGVLGSSGPFIIACGSDSVAWIEGGVQARFAACVFQGFAALIFPQMLNIIGCGFNEGPDSSTGRLNVEGGTITAADDNDLTHCELNLYGGTQWTVAGGASRALGIFDNESAVGAIRVNVGLSAYNQSDGTIYGSGNTGRHFYVLAGAFVRVSKVGFTAVTSAPSALLVEDGVVNDYDVADISIVNPLGGGIVDPASP